MKIIFFLSFFSINVFVRNSFKHSLFTFLLLHNLHFIYFHPNSYNFKNAVPCLFAAKFSQHFNSGGSSPTEYATTMISIRIFIVDTEFNNQSYKINVHRHCKDFKATIKCRLSFNRYIATQSLN